MNLNLEVCTKEDCRIYVKDTTAIDNSSGYLDEDEEILSQGKFKYSDTVGIVVVSLEKYGDNGNEVNTYRTLLHDDIDKKDEGVRIDIDFDGVFNVVLLVLPTIDWIVRMRQNHPAMLEIYDTVYYYDEGNVYKLVKEGEELVEEASSLKEILERNTEGTTVSRVCKTHVSVCHLFKCYLSLCQQIFEARGFSKCFDKAKIDHELQYKRDMVWMALNVIRYLVECERLQEVQRIIQEISGCNGLCPGWYYNEGKERPDCGCGKPPRCNCG